MRLRIARDVLLQLKNNRYIAQTGAYIYVCDVPYHVNTLTASFKDTFAENDQVNCTVCALGAACASLVNIENKCGVYEIQNSGLVFERLSKYFSPMMLAMMESAFEMKQMERAFEGRDVSRSVRLYDTLDLAVEWGERYDEDADRLRAIMLNIVRNKGDFKLPKKMLAKIGSIA